MMFPARRIRPGQFYTLYRNPHSSDDGAYLVQAKDGQDTAGKQ